VQQIDGWPILRVFCEGWDTTNLDTDRRLSHPLQKRKGWGTRLFVVLHAVPNTNRGLFQNLFPLPVSYWRRDLIGRGRCR
jgi:hypothetical protein